MVIPPTYKVCGYTPDLRSMWFYPRHMKYVIPLTYEVCYTPDIRSMWLYPRHMKYVIPPTYKVCGYTPDIQSMWLYPRHTKYVVIPPTYKVCGYTPDIRSMWGYNVLAFPFVRSFVCMFVCSSFRHRVKVFCVKVYDLIF